MKDYNTTSEKVAAIKSLWSEWALAYGAVTMTVVLSTIFPSIWLAAVALALAWGLKTMARTRRDKSKAGCMRFAVLMSRALFMAAIVMTAINIVFHTTLIEHFFDPETVNTTIPFIASLIIFPLTTVVAALGWINHGKSHYCHRCKTHHGYRPEDGFIGNFFHAQTKRQLRVMTVLSAVISLVDWVYYALYYNNINFSESDRLYFIVLPVVLYLASLCFFGHHYYVIINTIRHDGDGANSQWRPVIMRFLVVRNDMLLLEPGLHNLLDTPAECTHDFTAVDLNDASRAFCAMSGLEADKFALRLLYQNLSITFRATIYHYLVTLDEVPEGQALELPPDFKLKGQWATLHSVDRLIKMHAIAPPLAAEIYRVYTIGRAFKTYHHDGRRRYTIPDYHPNMRLRDIHNLDVDFNDSSWFDVAENNQDHTLWRLRNLLRRIFRLSTRHSS